MCLMCKMAQVMARLHALNPCSAFLAVSLCFLSLLSGFLPGTHPVALRPLAHYLGGRHYHPHSTHVYCHNAVGCASTRQPSLEPHSRHSRYDAFGARLLAPWSRTETLGVLGKALSLFSSHPLSVYPITHRNYPSLVSAFIPLLCFHPPCLCHRRFVPHLLPRGCCRSLQEAAAGASAAGSKGGRRNGQKEKRSAATAHRQAGKVRAGGIAPGLLMLSGRQVSSGTSSSSGSTSRSIGWIRTRCRMNLSLAMEVNGRWGIMVRRPITRMACRGVQG